MKKLFSALLLLLATVLLFTSCDFSGASATETDTGIENTSTPFEDPSAVPQRDPAKYEWWLNNDTELAFEVEKEGNGIIFYSLQTGYYTYYTYEEGTYVKDGDALIVSIYDTTYTFVYNASDDTYAIKNSAADQADLVYTRQEKQPTMHPSYDFPDFSAQVFTAPIDMGDYQKAKLKEIALEEARIKIFLDYYSSSLEPYPEITDRGIQKGDYINIDYIGYLNGTIIEGAGGTDQFLPVISRPEKIDNVQRVDDFINGMIGHRAGESFEIEVNFPADYSNELVAGKKTVFNVTVNYVYDVRLTDKQFATYKDLDFDTYDAYLESVAKAIVRDEGLPYLTEQLGLSDLAPMASYRHFYQTYLDSAHFNAKRYYQMEYEEYLTITGQSEAIMLAQSKKTAADFILGYYVADQFDLEWSEEQFDAQHSLMVDEYLENGVNKDKAIELIKNERMNELYAELTYQIACYHLVSLVFGA